MKGASCKLAPARARNLFRVENYYRINVEYENGEEEHSRLFTSGNCPGNSAGHTPVVHYQNGELMLIMPPGTESEKLELQICDRVGRLLEKKVFQTDSDLDHLYLPIQLKSDLYLILMYAPSMGMASSKLLVE